MCERFRSRRMAPCQSLVAAACLCVGARARAYWEVQDGFCKVDGEGCIKTAEFMGGDYMGGVNCNFRVIREDWKRSDIIVVEYFDVDPDDWLQIPLTGPNGLVSQIDLHAGTETGSGWYPNGIHWYPDDGHIIDLGPGKMQPTGVVTFFSTSPSPHGKGFRVCPSSSNPLLVPLLVVSAAICLLLLPLLWCGVRSCRSKSSSSSYSGSSSSSSESSGSRRPSWDCAAGDIVEAEVVGTVEDNPNMAEDNPSMEASRS